MAQLGNTIINGMLRINGDIITGGSITASSLIGNLTGNADTATKATQDSDGNAINTTYLKKSGGTMTGDIIMYKNDSGETPAIIFQRGTTTDGYDDWKVYNKSGKLYFAEQQSNGSYSDIAGIDTNGFSGVFNGNASTATKATQDSDGNAINTTYVKLATSQTITGPKTFTDKVSSHMIGTQTVDDPVLWSTSNIVISSEKNNENCTFKPTIGFVEKGTSDGTLYMRNRALYWCSSSALANEVPEANIGYKILHTGNFTSAIGDVLLKSGGTLTEAAQLQRTGKSCNWYNGRDNAFIKQSSYTGYSPILSTKTTDGSWELGAYVNNKLYLSYITDADYAAGTNERTREFIFNVETNTMTANIDGNAATATSANTADYPYGFTRKATVQNWGNQNGTFVTGWVATANAEVAFRANSGQLNQILDGFYYCNEGNSICTYSSDNSTKNIQAMSAADFESKKESMPNGSLVAVW